MNKRIKLAADSSADTLFLQGVDFSAAALKIITAEKEYVDDAGLDVGEMVRELARYNGRSSTACPSPGDWLTAFGDGEEILCVTITGNLSGSYNAACIAADDYLAQHPGRRVHVINSLSAGPELTLLLEKLRQLILQGLTFEELCREAESYLQRTALVFMLESMHNLAKNGRVSPLAAKAAGILGIRAVGKASDQGTLALLDKCRGEKKALESMLRNMENLGYAGGAVRISHCLAENAAAALEQSLLAKYPDARVEIAPCRGLCSFYAEQGGLLVGFERETI